MALFTPPCFGEQTCVRLQAEGGQWDPTLLGLSGTASVCPCTCGTVHAIHDHLNLWHLNGMQGEEEEEDADVDVAMWL